MPLGTVQNRTGTRLYAFLDRGFRIPLWQIQKKMLDYIQLTQTKVFLDRLCNTNAPSLP